MAKFRIGAKAKRDIEQMLTVDSQHSSLNLCVCTEYEFATKLTIVSTTRLAHNSRTLLNMEQVMKIKRLTSYNLNEIVKLY